jgi:midasin
MDPVHQAKEKEQRKEGLERIKAGSDQLAKYQEAQKKRSQSREANQTSSIQMETVHDEEEDPGKIRQRSQIFHPAMFNQGAMVEGEVTNTYETVDSVMQNTCKNEEGNESMQSVPESDNEDDSEEDDNEDDDNENDGNVDDGDNDNDDNENDGNVDDGDNDKDDNEDDGDNDHNDDLSSVNETVNGDNTQSWVTESNAVSNSKGVKEVIAQDSIVMDRTQDQDSSASEPKAKNQ